MVIGDSQCKVKVSYMQVMVMVMAMVLCTCEPMLCPALVGLEAVLGGNVPDLEFPAGQYNVLPI